MSPRIPLGVVAHFEKYCEFRLNFTIQLYPEKLKNDQTHCNKTHDITFIYMNMIIIMVPQLCLFLDMSSQ